MSIQAPREEGWFQVSEPHNPALGHETVIALVKEEYLEGEDDTDD